MNPIREKASSVPRGLLKVALIAFSALFVLTVLCIGLLFVAVTAIRFVLTGRKPAVFATFTQFNKAAQRFRPGQWSAQGPHTPVDPGDVVDVQAHEVPPAPGSLPPAKTAG
jgi:hypothetical protein